MLDTYTPFNKWLADSDWDRTNKATSFCMPILRIIAERALDLKKSSDGKAGFDNNVVEFRKQG